MRSTTPEILSAATTSRRSPAIGARNAISWTARRSVSTSSASSFLSSWTMRAAPSLSRWTRQRIASLIACSARPPIWLMSARSRSMSSSNALSVCPLACCIFLLRSAVAAGDIILRALLPRVREDRRRLAVFHQLPEVEERRPLRHARCLLHVMSNDRDRIAAAKLVDQLLDLRRRDRVERRAGFVHQNDFRIHSNRASDAQALLLPARQRGAAFLKAVLDLFPQAGTPERLFDDLLELRFRAGKPVDAGAVGDVLKDRLGEWIRLLEHHPDTRAQLDDVHRRAGDVLAVKLDPAIHARRRDRVVHAVEAAQECRFAAARR